MIHNPKQIIVRTYRINNSINEQPNTNRSLNDHLRLHPSKSNILSKFRTVQNT